MNVAALMIHTCDIARSNVPVTDNANRDAYRQPRVKQTVINTGVPCVFYSNIARNLFMTDVLKSAGSVLAQIMIDAAAVPDGIHLGDVFTNVQDEKGHVVSSENWFGYRISKYADKSGTVYFNVMLAFDQSGPRN